MDAEHFDSVVKALGQGNSRRRVLAGLLAAALAAPVGRAAADDTPKPNGKKCNKDAQCLSGFCVRSEGGKQGTCVFCASPAATSSYALTCFNINQTCTASGRILTADCEDSFGDLVPAEINVNDCGADGYVIANCNGVLTCGGC